MHRPHRAFTVVATTAPAALTLAALGVGPASATAGGSSVAARRAGVAHRGDAYAGWSVTGSPARDVRAHRASLDAQPVGIDVSSHQGDVDWSAQSGLDFAYVKATEGTGYTNGFFAQQYDGSYQAGLVRGAYHFATPDTSSGTAQADFFVGHGGGWSGDGRTLPGALDIEYNPYGAECYGLSKAAMTDWVAAFTAEYRARTGRDAVIYTTADWWATCTGSTAFGATNPLWVARYGSSVGRLPAGWGVQTFWQYTSTPVDHDTFNGSRDRLVALANG